MNLNKQPWKWLTEINWLNLGGKYEITQAGVHILLCFSIMSLITSLVCLNKWVGVGYIIPAFYPLVKEFVIDGHRFDTDTAEDIKDLITDLITNYLGVLLGIPFTILNLIMVQ